jgi:hypothetical protein
VNRHWKPTQNITKDVRNISRYQLRCNTSQRNMKNYADRKYGQIGVEIKSQ